MVDILSQLAIASFRGVEFEVSSRSYDFVQEQARHRLIYQDGALIESLGSDNPAYRYTIPFREGIVKGSVKNYFTVQYPDFLEACQDRSRGVLEDPLHGAVNVRCVRLSEIVDVGKRDGIDVEVEFVVAPLLDDIAGDLGTVISTLEGSKVSASLFDQEVKKIDWKQENPPEPALDPLDAATSVTNQIEVAGGKITAQMDNLAFRMDRAKHSIDRVKDPSLAPMRTSASRMQLAALRLKQTAATPPRPTKVVEASRDIGRLAAATLYGLTVQEFIRLNPAAARTAVIKRGTPLKIFRDSDRR